MSNFSFYSILLFILFCVLSLVFVPLNIKSSIAAKKSQENVYNYIIFHSDRNKKLEDDISKFLAEVNDSSLCILNNDLKRELNKEDKALLFVFPFNGFNRYLGSFEKMQLSEVKIKFLNFTKDLFYSKKIVKITPVNSYNEDDIEIINLNSINTTEEHRYLQDNAKVLNIFYIDNFHGDQLSEECKKNIFEHETDPFDFVCDQFICTFADWSLTNAVKNTIMNFENDAYLITDKYKNDVAVFMNTRYQSSTLKAKISYLNQKKISKLNKYRENLQMSQKRFFDSNYTNSEIIKRRVSDLKRNINSLYIKMQSQPIVGLSKNPVFEVYVDILFGFIFLNCELNYYKNKHPVNDNVLDCCLQKSYDIAKNALKKHFISMQKTLDIAKITIEECSNFNITGKFIEDSYWNSTQKENFLVKLSENLKETFKNPTYVFKPKVSILSQVKSYENQLYMDIKLMIQRSGYGIDFKKKEEQI